MNRSWRRDLAGADPYQVVGVTPDATRDEIVKAYRRRIRQLHPDRPTGDEEQTKLLYLARDVLLDPPSRAEYDRSVPQRAPGAEIPANPPAGAWDTEDVVAGTRPPRRERATYRRAPPRCAEWAVHRPAPPYRSYAQPAYDGYNPYRSQFPRRPPPESLALPVTALAASLICSPAGLLLGLIAFSQSRRHDGSGRTISIAATAVGGIYFLCFVGWFGWSMLSSRPGS